MQCDGYAAYKTIAAAAAGEAITLAFCWAHLRRKFFDIAKGGNAPSRGNRRRRGRGRVRPHSWAVYL